MLDAIDKAWLLGEVRARLEGELRVARERARDAADAATHEENRPEGDKDMRSTEASYIARGQAERAVEIERAILHLKAIEVRRLLPDDPICASALVEVESDAGRAVYFLLPVAGGERFETPTLVVSTLATTSPLGRALLGLSMGDEAEVQAGGAQRTIAICRVA